MHRRQKSILDARRLGRDTFRHRELGNKQLWEILWSSLTEDTQKLLQVHELRSLTERTFESLKQALKNVDVRIRMASNMGLLDSKDSKSQRQTSNRRPQQQGSAWQRFRSAPRLKITTIDAKITHSFDINATGVKFLVEAVVEVVLEVEVVVEGVLALFDLQNKIKDDHSLQDSSAQKRQSVVFQ